MALRGAACVLLRAAVDGRCGARVRGLRSTAVLCRWSPPGGPMPNEDIEWTQLDSLEKYRSYTRYVRTAEEADGKEVWWKTYRKYREEERKQAVQPVNIGLPYQQPSRMIEVKERKKVIKENKRNPDLEREDRLRRFRIPLDKVKAEWEKTNGPYHIRRLAEHYGIYKDLFPMAYFVPRVMLRVTYGDSNAVVHFGNRLTPSQTAQAPQISFEAEENSLWTLLLTSPDEHLMNNEREYLHWLVYCLKQRTFQTVDFYRKHQDAITPAGLAFFQSQWDESVTHTFHELLNMREPVFEYDRPPVYHPPQKKYPHGQPLRYLDRYRDGTEHTYGIY